METIIRTIVQKKIPCHFISPHLDDAVLSCGGLIRYLSNKTDVSVITVFTEADGDFHTLSAKAFLKQCGVSDAEELFSKRRYEDGKILGSLGVPYVHLGYTDALWRKKKIGRSGRMLGAIVPEYVHIYPTYRFHIVSGRINKADENMMREIRRKLIRLIGKKKPSIVFFPIGLGGHIDHVVASKIGERFPGETAFYSDFPYCLTDRLREDVLRLNGFTRETFDKYLKDKNRLIKMYETQPLFDGDPPMIPETLFFPKDLSVRL